ncbi:hypothetical protein B0H11DRAFT_1958305 [Mycena galericulata]|nr:hypothetical protein B0H11DRAFT_1958305 [Mycena galericulata]
MSTTISLRIAASSVGLYPTLESTTVQLPTTNTGFICLLSGPLSTFTRYSRQEHSKWLLDIAHDICDPRYMRGSLTVWDETRQEWRPVSPADPLIALLPGILVGLTKLSMRFGKSKTADDPAVSMRTSVLERDGNCWITGLIDPLNNSHICPKRMGDHLAHWVFQEFCSTEDPRPGLVVLDPVFGLALSRTLDTYWDAYELGFRFVQADQYECHSFAENFPNHTRTIYGTAPNHQPLPPVLHGRPVSAPRPQNPDNPPAGLFRWHYLQCVLRNFAHADYKNLVNIQYSELPVPLEGDSDDEGTDSEAEWPTAALDRGRALRNKQEHDRRIVADWIAEL